MMSGTPASIRSLLTATPAAPTPDEHDPQVLHPLVHQLGRVQEPGQHHHRGAVLVVVEDGDVELASQPALDLEAARRGDVLEVDAAEPGGDRLDDRDDLLGVLRVQAERPGVDPGELLEEHRLALHHRHRGRRADVAEPEHRGAVGDDGDRVLLDRERRGPCRDRRLMAMQTRATPGV